MKKTLFVAEQGYEAPALQLLDFAVEQGFTTSGIYGDEGEAGDGLTDENNRYEF